MTSTGLAAAPSLPVENEHGHTVLVVDDEPRIRNVVVRALELERIAAHGVADGESALAMLSARTFDLVVLDLLMPGRDGFSALDDIARRHPGQAVLVLSCLSETSAKVHSLNLGADDYLTKPFHVEELLARVRARLRAVHRHAPATQTYGRLTLDLVNHRVDVAGRPVQLSDREFQVLSELLNHRGRTVTKQHLLSSVWGYAPEEAASVSNVVDVSVRRLRSRLGGDVIETVRGEGYRVN